MNIAVTGLNATDNPGPGVPVIRSIKEGRGDQDRIIGLLYDTLEPGVYMDRIADRSYLIPYPSSGLENIFERIVYIHSKEHLDLIIPTLDSELYGFHKLAGRLRDLGIHTFLPNTEQLNMRAKDKLFAFCYSNDIKAPKTYLVNSLQELYSIPSKLNYPFVVKGIFYDAQIVQSLDEAVSAFNRIRLKWGLPIIIQEFLSGDEFNLCALGDGKGETVGAVAMRKTYITEKGKGWAGVSIFDPALLELAKKVIRKTMWTGGMELEFIKVKSTNEYYLLEINPRFPAWVYFCSAVGQNLPEAFVRLAMGDPVTPFQEYETGKLFVRCSWDLIADIKKFEQLTTVGEA